MRPERPDKVPPMATSLSEALRGAGFRGELVAEASLAPLTTWRIGGPAELLASPTDLDDLLRAISWANGASVPWRILGNGSNLLVRDAGVDGLVLRIRKTLDDVAFSESTVVAGAGASLPALANAAAARGLAGIEFGAGIPGSVGGAIVMNAGWHEFEIGNSVVAVSALTKDGELVRLTRDLCGFGYRTSVFRHGDKVVVGTELALTPDDPAAVTSRLARFAESRKTNQPTELPSCGSVFLKPPGDFAGRLIEAAGLKGRRVGGVEVSEKHANFFVNRGGATSRDALALVEEVERAVLDKHGVKLTREFEIW
jgi:UDP-N-acetylmuramate dehydrogenase